MECVQGWEGCDGSVAPPTLLGLVSGQTPLNGVEALPPPEVRSRLLLRLVSDGSLRFAWVAGGWRLRVDSRRLRALALRTRRLSLALCPGVADALAVASQVRQDVALERVHEARVLESVARKRKLEALHEYHLAGGQMGSAVLRAVMERSV